LSKKDKGSFFRIAIKGGGCSGFQYEFTFDQSKNDDDLNYEKILIDKTSADLLKGSEVDYVSELIGESFKIRTDLIKDKLKQSRIISAEIEYKKKNIQLINIYTPNGNPVDTEKYEYKKDWMDQLIKQLKSLSKKNSNIILAGDFNVIPSAEDVYNVKSFEDDALYRLEIRKKFREMLNIGFNDVYRHFNEDKEGYTFWDYMRGAWQKNNGMRIDHFLVSNSIIDNIKDININKDPRGREKPSDHTPIEIKLA
jgi:exodeoxyribonuclease-3